MKTIRVGRRIVNIVAGSQDDHYLSLLGDDPQRVRNKAKRLLL
jgi:hypothetical protein